MNHAQKLPRGVSGRPPGHQRPLGVLEWIVLVHVGVLVLFGAWAFGGNTLWARNVMTWWGSLSLLITLTAAQDSDLRKQGYLRPLRWLWPLGLFDVLVLASALNPSYREVTDGARTLYVESHARLPLPSSARPDLSLLNLWFFNAVYLSCFNLALVVRQRRALRALLLAIAANAMLLAIFGTVQRLIGAKGLFFGAVPSRQVHFFASFIYHNHWGAFTVLMTAVSLGLVFHFARRNTSARNFFHSPAFAGLVAIVLLAASIPLSTSRSCTVLVVVLLLGAFAHWIIRVVRRRRAFRESIAVPVAGAAFALVAVAALTATFAGSIISSRLNDTRDQLAAMQQSGEIIPRQALYRDTWNMAREKIWFGWGMGSYPTVFQTHNSRPVSPVDGLPIFYHDAHSDWLQSASEVGLVGTTLLGLCALVPLWHRRRVVGQSPLSVYLLAGCTLVALYAWLEFPFGNRAVIAAWWFCFFCAIHYGRLDGSGEAAS